ncbi:hypothetical protein GCM10022214_75490 [Actinomadura miaoliensis]|uniref:Resolvase/invertase-type recombinase catalytic domain-containing protein n=1 Tax=Actinomadura miaoliensis TaxID=430685 RepID=A0ABP7WYT5_9ACTN
MHRARRPKISTRATRRPELDRAVSVARELRASGVAVTVVVHEHERLGRGIELAAPAEQLKAAGVGLEFLTGELQGSHDPSGIALHRPCDRPPLVGPWVDFGPSGFSESRTATPAARSATSTQAPAPLHVRPGHGRPRRLRCIRTG